jgi:putative ABC transport system substrate-binding protein
MILEFRSADGRPERYSTQARELIDLKCDVIFTLGSHLPARALLDLGTAVPSVFWAGDYDPVEKGIVKSLTKPGGYMTGVYAPQAAVVAKRMEVLRDLVPQPKRFAVFADPWSKDHVAAAKAAAETLRVQLSLTEFSAQPYDFEGAIEGARRDGAQGIVFLNSPVFAERFPDISPLLVKRRMPSVGGAYSGVLIRYHGNTEKAGARVADIGVRVLKGQRPADIPVEQNDEYVIVINTRVAKAIGITIPESVRARATRIVQ